MPPDSPVSDTSRAIQHDPDTTWPTWVKLELVWEIDGRAHTRVAHIDGDHFFGRGCFGAPMEGVAIVSMIENMRRDGPLRSRQQKESPVARKSVDGVKMEMVAVAKIEAYPNNAKVHPEVQVGQIMASIRQFGFVSPILIDRDGVVVAGHGRLLAASRLGMEQVPVIRLGHLTPEQAKALRIADNSIAESGTRWDVDLLEAELASLRAVKFDLEPLGLDSIELPEMEELQQVAPKPNRSKTTIFVSITNAQVEKARKVIVAALDKAKIGHNL